MENLVKSARSFNPSGQRILVTGHTGFKGAWLCEWLLGAGGCVAGLGLPPEASNSLFDVLRLSQRLEKHIVCDIRNADALKKAIADFKPDVIFHLAAQALVRRSYREPLLTWETNVIGTLNLLEAARSLAQPVVVVAVTTDKVYRNKEWEFSYRENDELGGHDPYSASKAACELAVASWRESFISETQVKVVTARAGNVIGPGDFSEDRIVPDCYRAWLNGNTVILRNPLSTRPWQHVLEPLSGYLTLAAYCLEGRNPSITECNFGPGAGGDHTVENLVTQMAMCGAGRKWNIDQGTQPHEARSLSLSVERARHLLGWFPRLSFEETVVWTDSGYRISREDLPQLIRNQISLFCNI